MTAGLPGSAAACWTDSGRARPSRCSGMTSSALSVPFKPTSTVQSCWCSLWRLATEWEAYAEKPEQRASGETPAFRRATEAKKSAPYSRKVPEIPKGLTAGRLVPADEVGGDYWSIKHYPRDNAVT